MSHTAYGQPNAGHVGENHNAPNPSRDDHKSYCRVAAGGAIACLTLLAGDSVADFEGLVWRDGRVLFEFIGSVNTRGESLAHALEAALAARLRLDTHR